LDILSVSSILPDGSDVNVESPGTTIQNTIIIEDSDPLFNLQIDGTSLNSSYKDFMLDPYGQSIKMTTKKSFYGVGHLDSNGNTKSIQDPEVLGEFDFKLIIDPKESYSIIPEYVVEIQLTSTFQGIESYSSKKRLYFIFD